MDSRFIPTEMVPSKTQFGLDQLRRSYKTSLSASDAVTAAPSIGTADEVFPKMFLVAVTTPESAEKATHIDLTYMGCIKTDGGGNPVLPVSQITDDDAVMTASSNKAATGATAVSPLTVQFYAPSSNLSWVTFNAEGVVSSVDDPTRAPEIITLTFLDTAFSATSYDVGALVNVFFSIQITATIRSQEIVKGKYWINTGKKVRHFVPYIFTLAAGYYPQPYTGGINYVVGDSISVASGGTCTMTVTATSAGGGVAGTFITSNSMTVASSGPISATGGTGSGARFTVVHLP